MSIFSTVQVKDGSGSWQETLDGVDVTPGNIISIRLKDATGVSSWYLRSLGTDEESITPTLSDVNPGTHLVLSPTTEVTFTMEDADGRAFGFHSRVDGTDPSHISKFAVFTLTMNGDRVGFVGMTHEGDSEFGWTRLVNKLIRNATPGGVDATSIQGTPVYAGPSLGQGLVFNGTAYSPTDLPLKFARADNSSGARAVPYRRTNLTGGRSWSEGFQYYVGRNIGASPVIRSLTSDSITSPAVGPSNIPAAMASCLLGDEVFFTGTWNGEDGWLWSYNINEGTSRKWAQFSAVGDADIPLNGNLPGMNCTDLVAHTDWVGGNFIAGVQPNGFYLMNIYRSMTNPVTGNPFYTKCCPNTTDGFLGGRIAVSMKGQNSSHKFGQIMVTAPNENTIYLYDWNGGVCYGAWQFPGLQPTAICADAEENIWVCDTAGDRVYKMEVGSDAATIVAIGDIYINDPRDIIFDGQNIIVMSVANNAFYRIDPRRMVVDATLAANGADVRFGLYGGSLNADWSRMVWDGETVWFRSTTDDIGHFDPASMTWLGTPDYSPVRSNMIAIAPGVMAFWVGGGTTLQFTCTNMGGNQAFNSISWLDRPLDVELGGGTSNEYAQATSGVVRGIVNTSPQVVGFARLVHPSNESTQSHKIAKKGRRYRRVRFRGEGHCTATGTLTIKVYDCNGASGAVGYLASATQTITTVGGYVGGPVSTFDVELTELTSWINTLAPAVTSGLFEVVAYVDAAGANAELYRTDIVVSWETA